jgi:hypothetical protein
MECCRERWGMIAALLIKTSSGGIRAKDLPFRFLERRVHRQGIHLECRGRRMVAFKDEPAVAMFSTSGRSRRDFSWQRMIEAVQAVRERALRASATPFSPS